MNTLCLLTTVSYLVQRKSTAHQVPQVNSSAPTCYITLPGTRR